MQGLLLDRSIWLDPLFPLGVAFTDPSLADRFSIHVCSLIALVFIPVTVLAAGHGL